MFVKWLKCFKIKDKLIKLNLDLIHLKKKEEKKENFAIKCIKIRLGCLQVQI